MDVVALQAAKADALRTAAASITPPSNPKMGQIWLSSAVKDLRVPPDADDRTLMTVTPAGDAAQEAAIWTDDTHYRMLYIAGQGPRLASCLLTADPTVGSNWVTYGSGPVLGAGNGVTQINHGSIYVEGNNLYYHGNDQIGKTVRVYTATKSDPTTWTMVGSPCMVLADMPTGATAFGNTFVVKDLDNTYILFIEYQAADGRWQMTQARGNTPTGTFTRLTEKLTSLYPEPSWSMGGATWVTYENGQWILLYLIGYGSFGNLPTEIYRATAPSLGADNWTVLDKGRPYMRRAAKYEIDQVADPEFFRSPGGQAYLVTTGLDNRSPLRARLYITELLPTRKRWDGVRWVALDKQAHPTRGTTQPTRPVLKTKTTDLSGTASAWANLTDMAIVFAPSGTDFEVELKGVFTPTGDATTRYQFRVQTAVEVGGNPTTVNISLGAIAGTNGAPVMVSTSCVVPRAVVEKYIVVNVQYQVTSGATLHCRPVAQAGFEYAVMKCTDIAYQPSTPR